MSVDIVNFTIYQYASFNTTVQWTSTAGFPINMQGIQVAMYLANTYDDDPFLILTNEEGGGIVVNSAEGLIDITITPEQTAGFDFINCVYDLTATDVDGPATRIIGGYITLERGVKR